MAQIVCMQISISGISFVGKHEISGKRLIAIKIEGSNHAGKRAFAFEVSIYFYSKFHLNFRLTNA